VLHLKFVKMESDVVVDIACIRNVKEISFGRNVNGVMYKQCDGAGDWVDVMSFSDLVVSLDGTEHSFDLNGRDWQDRFGRLLLKTWK
jgi:hypothetical protein